MNKTTRFPESGYRVALFFADSTSVAVAHSLLYASKGSSWFCLCERFRLCVSRHHS